MPRKHDSQPPPLKTGLTYNLKRDSLDESEAEFDSIDTINAIANALEKIGCKVILLEADASLPENLINTKPDIVFNIAEGRNGRGREAHVPSILSYYGIKYTGSDETALCVCLDKALAKRVLISHKIKTPRYQVIKNTNYKLNKSLEFPLIAKPNAEGSSKGISSISVVKDSTELKNLAEINFSSYGYELLLEEYIVGREFTVGVLGNGDETRVFRPMELVFRGKDTDRRLYDYSVKKNYQDQIDYVCPAHLSQEQESFMISTAKKIYDVLECRDFARIDFMLSEFNELYFIEINPLAGLTPGYSDYPMLAEANGVAFDELISSILKAALKRYGIEGML